MWCAATDHNHRPKPAPREREGGSLPPLAAAVHSTPPPPPLITVVGAHCWVQLPKADDARVSCCLASNNTSDDPKNRVRSLIVSQAAATGSVDAQLCRVVVC